MDSHLIKGFAPLITDSQFPSPPLLLKYLGFCSLTPIQLIFSAPDSLEKPKTSVHPALIYSLMAWKLEQTMCLHLSSPHGTFLAYFNATKGSEGKGGKKKRVRNIKKIIIKKLYY